jgi:lipid-A-disaccharide synthase-like uncharacterized protein
MDWSDHPFWLAFGLLGNAAFFSRFLIQWVVSERKHRSVVPMAFWYLSILGSIILLIYAIHRKDPIFTLAYTPNAVVYFRNIVLRRREDRQKAQEDEAVENP